MKKNKKSEDVSEIVKKIVLYRKAMRDLSKELGRFDIEKDEQDQIRENVNKLRYVVSNIENEYFRDINKGMYLGLGIDLLDTASTDIVPVYLQWDKITNHVGVLGASGLGKTILMLSNIKDTIAKGWNTVIVDPKGGEGQEVVNGVMSFCKENNLLENTYYLSPMMPESSFLMNVIFGMGNVEVAITLRELMMGENTDPFYGDITYKVVLAIMYCFEFLEKVADEDGLIAKQEIDEELKKHKAIMKMNNLASRFDIANDTTEDGLVEDFASNSLVLDATQNVRSKRTLVTFRDIAMYVTHDDLSELQDLVEQTNIPDDHLYKAQMNKLKKDALFTINDALRQEKTFFSKVSTSLSTVLTKLSSGDVGDIFCTIRVNPMSKILASKNNERFILIVQPFPLTYGDISNTIIKLILKQLSSLFGNIGSTERKINRVAVFIDEAGSVFYPNISELYNKVRSLGGSIFAYTQSYQDYIDALGETKAKMVMDNINTTIRMGMNDIESAKKVVEEVGQGVEFNSTTVAATGTNDSRVIVQKNSEDILSPTDITMLPVGRGIVKFKDVSATGRIFLVDFAHYGKIYSNIKFTTNKYFQEIDRQNELGL